MKIEGGASLVGAEGLSQKSSFQGNNFNTESFTALGRTFAFVGLERGTAALSREVDDSSMAGASQKASGALAAKKLTRIAPFYSVSMGQAVMTPNLGKASLVTGVTPDDRLLSCSAIVLHNNQTGATGLYHFPAGNIHEDRDAQQILTRMRDEVAPTEGYIVYGTEDFSLLAQGKKSIVPSDPHSEKTRSYVSGLLPEGARLRRIPATLGVVSVSQNDHNLKIEQRHPQGPIVQTSQLQPYESYFTV